MKMTIGIERYTTRDVARACGGQLFGEEREIRAICTDSREADGGCMFVALRGEKTDGHRFIPAAIADGCRAVLCETYPTELPADMSAVIVPDTQAALSMIARDYLASLSPLRVAVTGSVGKTTTKEFLAVILSERFKTYKTEANYNSTIGMPMAALGVTPGHEAAVFEMGMSARGEIEQLSRIVCPDIAVITNVGTSHLEYLGTRENIACAKLEIIEGLRPGGVLIIDGDEPLLRVPVREDVKVITVSKDGAGDVCVENIVLHPENGTTTFDLRTDSVRLKDLIIPAVGEHIVLDAAYALAVGLHLGIDEAALRRGIMRYQRVSMRQQLENIGNVTVLADCYNASPESMRQALRVLGSYARERGGRAVAVLGDMRELGGECRRLHEEIGAFATELKADYLMTLGELGVSIAEGALGAGMPDERILMWRDLDDLSGAATALREKLLPGDMILVKASRGVAAERLIDALRDTNDK